jgi:hypothetical protein
MRSLMLSAMRAPMVPFALAPLALVSVLALPGCATPEQRAAQARAEIEQMMVVYGPACTRLGYAPQSDPWRSCILHLSAKEDAERYGPYPSYPHYYADYGLGRWPGGWWGPY